MKGHARAIDAGKNKSPARERRDQLAEIDFVFQCGKQGDAAEFRMRGQAVAQDVHDPTRGVDGIDHFDFAQFFSQKLLCRLVWKIWHLIIPGQG